MSVAGKKKSECCGCGACTDVCPRHCIEMRPDRHGFMYARVDTQRCVECGLCERVCPIPADESAMTKPATAYAAWSREPEIHRRSASGGAAYLLGRHVIERGGVVYGCAADGLTVHHVRIDDVAALSRLQGSKYVQSDTRGIYRMLRDDLRAGSTVLFTGTPCQCAAARGCSLHAGGCLITAEIICHGVPSQKMLRDHLRPISKGREADQISFRSGNSYVLRLTADGEEIYSGKAHDTARPDAYLSAFINGKTLRPSCHSCPYARPERASDITMGDFWGYRDTLPEAARDGLSVIMPSTADGKRLFEDIKPMLNTIERPAEEAIDGNTQLRHPFRLRPTGRLFDMLYSLLPFNAAVRLSDLPSLLRRTAEKQLHR